MTDQGPYRSKCAECENPEQTVVARDAEIAALKTKKPPKVPTRVQKNVTKAILLMLATMGAVAVCATSEGAYDRGYRLASVVGGILAMGGFFLLVYAVLEGAFN